MRWRDNLAHAHRDSHAEAPASLVVDRFGTPIGEMYAVTDDRGRLRAFAWADHESRGIQQLRRQYGPSVGIDNGQTRPR
ncbi:MAG: hypothetical protein WDO56_32050 [Gammaproteobacteria bacterium]